MTLEQWIVLIGVILGPLLTYLVGSRVASGQVANQVSEAWERLNKPLETRINELMAEIETMRIEREKNLRFIGELIRGMKIHFDQFERNGIKSEWQPSDELKPLFDEILNAQATQDRTPTQPEKSQKRGGLGLRK